MKRVLIGVLMAILVFVPGFAAAQPGQFLGGLLNPNTLCAGAGVGTGLGVSGKHGAGWGTAAGVGVALLCKGVTDAAGMGQPPVVYSHPAASPPPVFHQPGAVYLPGPGFGCPKPVRTRVLNQTSAVIFVMTPGGEQRLEPGGITVFNDCRGTGAGSAFYAVNARAMVYEHGNYFMVPVHEWTHPTGGYIHGLQEYAVEFKPYRWETDQRKLVPAPAIVRQEIVPAPEVHGTPPVQVYPPAPVVPQSSSAGPQSGADEQTKLLAEIEALKLRIKELEAAKPSVPPTPAPSTDDK